MIALYLVYILTLLKHMQIKEDYSLLGHIWITSVCVGHLQKSGAPQNVAAKVALSIHFWNFCVHDILKVETEWLSRIAGALPNLESTFSQARIDGVNEDFKQKHITKCALNFLCVNMFTCVPY